MSLWTARATRFETVVRKLARKFHELNALALAVLVLLLLTSCGSIGGSPASRKAPPPPHNVQVKQVPAGLQISWTCVQGAAKYTVFWGFDRGEYRGMVDSDNCAVILAGLHKGELYYLSVTAWNGKGESAFSQEQAFVYEDDPKKAAAYLSKGYALLRDGLYVDAQAYLSAVIRLDPQNADAYHYRAMLHEKTSRSDLARADHAMAERLNKRKPLSEGRASGELLQASK
jgi:tetratricopeptide (TPR) repeat protein